MKIFSILILVILNANLISASNKNVTSLAPSCSEIGSISMKKYPNLINVTIKNCNLKTVPKNILKITKLKNLDLSNNNISNLDKDLNKLTQLTSLTIRNNQIKSFDNITKLTKLKKLDLSGNYLSKINVLHKYSNLEKLNLSYNALNSIADLSGLTKLNDINLSYNQLIKMPKMPNNIKKINVEKNYLDLNNKCCNQYLASIVNQNKITLKDNLSELQIAKAINSSRYVKDLVVSSDGSSVVEFSNYILLIKADDKIYNINKFIEDYDSLDVSTYSIVVDVVAHDKNKYRLNGEQNYSLEKTTPLLQNITSTEQEEEKKETKDKSIEKDSSFTREIKKHDYFNNYIFKTLSIVVCAIFIIPVIAIIIIFIYLNKLNKDVNKTIFKRD